MECKICKLDKPVTEFYIPKSGYLHKKCKECERTRKLNGYYKDKDSYNKRSKLSILRNRQFIDQYKSEHPCVKCGESDICCLDFHHQNPEDKKYAIAKLKRGYSNDTILAEISKCIVLCANCHRKFHIGRFSLPLHQSLPICPSPTAPLP